jgi:hypothetical protein
MESFYKQIIHQNGDMYLEKVIVDEDDYEIIELHNGDKLLKKKIIKPLTLQDIKQYDFTKSKIKYCKIDDEVITSSFKYKPILEIIYSKINNGTKIIKNSKLNILTVEKTDEGFKYLENIGISYQGADANKCIYEIMNQSQQNNISISMKIELNNKKNINILIY